MNQIVFVGAALPAPALVEGLYQHGYSITFTRQIDSVSPATQLARGTLVVLSLDADLPISRLAQTLRQLHVPWLAWNRTDAATPSRSACTAGAFAVLPRMITTPVLLQTIDNLLATRPLARGVAPVVQRHYRRGTTIALERNAILDIIDGIVAQTMIHPDGTAVLLGLCGPGQTLIGHPDDDCCIDLVAHTDTLVTLRSWADAAGDPLLPERLRTRVQLMEAWSAMQARPYLDQRVLGILTLLAEQFGEAHPHGLLVNVRITHMQLATAVGATRSTITRILGDLRTRGLLAAIGSGERERFCLCAATPSDHAVSAHTSGLVAFHSATA